jgi:hypothetical protein
MRLQDYYHNVFQQDLNALFHGIRPPEARIVTLGYDWVDRCNLLTRVPLAHRPSFLVCLHFTVLVDQAMHAHFLFCYADFEKLTLYPKFRLGLGHPAYLNPIRIFEDPIRCNLVTESDIRALIHEGMFLFAAETDDFFNRHMPQISASDFFNRILADPDVAPGYYDDCADSSESLPLRQVVARELKKVVSELPKRST